MYGFVVVGGLAAVWGVLIAVVEQPAVSDRRRVERWCTALLIASVATVGATIAGTALNAW